MGMPPVVRNAIAVHATGWSRSTRHQRTPAEKRAASLHRNLPSLPRRCRCALYPRSGACQRHQARVRFQLPRGRDVFSATLRTLAVARCSAPCPPDGRRRRPAPMGIRPGVRPTGRVRVRGVDARSRDGNNDSPTTGDGVPLMSASYGLMTPVAERQGFFCMGPYLCRPAIR